MHGITSLALLTGLAAAANHQVQVGANDELMFAPSTITAAMGDTVEFVWSGDRHSVVQGDQNNACQPLGGTSFYSGTISTGSWTITINNTNPIYYYCSVGRHCQSGMVGGINVASDSAFNDYKSKAASATMNVSPSTVQGGTVGSASSVAGSSSSSSASSSSSSSSSRVSSSSTSSTRMSSSMMSSTAGASSASSSSASMTGSSTGGAAIATQFAGVAAALPLALAALL